MEVGGVMPQGFFWGKENVKKLTVVMDTQL